ncbi:MAG: histidinol-phosphate transaminase [Desulfovibrio sp.]|jgi:histidinol-phosphate aminotransferase|nr:histidinol-phosphate transaminase [Desulfovibrio sp.]
MRELRVRPEVQALDPYVPGLSIAEIQQKYGISQVIKMASNENPLGASPLVQEALCRFASYAFRYPQGGNPRLVNALATLHNIDQNRIVVGNGSDEIIDLLLRLLINPGKNSIVCCKPCFSIYPIQGRIAGAQIRLCPLNEDFSFNFDGLLGLVDADTRLAFITTPDNPSGYCPPRASVRALADRLTSAFPDCLLVVDEAYMDFADDEAGASLLAAHELPDNVVFLRTFSKSYGMAGLRLGYGVLPSSLASWFWRARLPFSVNLLAEEGGLAALADAAFREATLQATRDGRKMLTRGLADMGCVVWPSAANFLLFQPPGGAGSARACFEFLLRKGIIIRSLNSYGLPEHLRVSVGNAQENNAFLSNMRDALNTSRTSPA